MGLGLYHHLIVIDRYVYLMSFRSPRSPAGMGQFSISLLLVVFSRPFVWQNVMIGMGGSVSRESTRPSWVRSLFSNTFRVKRKFFSRLSTRIRFRGPGVKAMPTCVFPRQSMALSKSLAKGVPIGFATGGETSMSRESHLDGS